MNDRINELQKLLQDEPEDRFLHYALGLEYIKTGNPDRALARFEFLLNKYSEYLPVYYQAAQLYVEKGDYQKAQSTYENGMALARRLNETKTLQELSNAFNNFLYDMDE